MLGAWYIPMKLLLSWDSLVIWHRRLYHIICQLSHFYMNKWFSFIQAAAKAKAEERAAERAAKEKVSVFGPETKKEVLEFFEEIEFILISIYLLYAGH